MKPLLRSALVLSLLGAGAAQGAVVTVTSVGSDATVPNQWNRVNYRDVSTGFAANTVAAITDTNARSGNGSVEISMAPSDPAVQGRGKADFTYYWGYDANRTLGSLNTLGFDWYRGADTAAAHFAPALRIAFDADGLESTTGDKAYLIWELTYQGSGVAVAPKNQWFSPDLMQAEFYQRRPGAIGEIPGYDIDLGEWKNGVKPASPNALALSASTAILGIEFGVGSGWNKQFVGFVDNVSVGFGAESTTFNFEVAQADVPEPASMALLGLGALGIGAARRRRQK